MLECTNDAVILEMGTGNSKYGLISSCFTRSKFGEFQISDGTIPTNYSGKNPSMNYQDRPQSNNSTFFNA